MCGRTLRSTCRFVAGLQPHPAVRALNRTTRSHAPQRWCRSNHQCAEIIRSMKGHQKPPPSLSLTRLGETPLWTDLAYDALTSSGDLGQIAIFFLACFYQGRRLRPEHAALINSSTGRQNPVTMQTVVPQVTRSALSCSQVPSSAPMSAALAMVVRHVVRCCAGDF